jgi:YD repeat-containing protein
MRKRQVLVGLGVWAISLTGLGISNAQANVSLKNGNFFIGYTDIVYPGGFEPRIERVYNSKTPYHGIFGWGWGNEYEAYLSVSADGSVVVHEYGGGAENRFNPIAFKKEELTRAIEMIANKTRELGGLGSQSQFEAYKKHLREDATFRNDEWEKLRAQNRLQPRQLVNGTQLHSNHFSYQYITKVAGGYIRTFDNGRSERFDDYGRLNRISDKNGNYIDFKYGKDGKIEKLTDNFNRKMFFSFNPQGLLVKIQGENGKEANFKYNDLGELVWSQDVDGNTYSYKYSSDKRHNMVEVGYSDKTTLAITYWGRDKHESVKSVKERDGAMSEYNYEQDSADRGHTSVSVDLKAADGKLISKSKYEYFVKTKADGEEWTQKMVTTIDGDRTETVYNECCGLPISIKRKGQETQFDYDAKGHVTKKVTPFEVTELAYDQNVGKVKKVVRYSKTNKKDSSWSTFEYDGKGNLLTAKNSDNKGVRLIYDNNGRIHSMIDQNKRRIDFKYNENSKPIEITDPALGTIKVSYTNSGEIKKVESSAGRKIAVEVTSAFQNLLEIIKPAGVTLSF